MQTQKRTGEFEGPTGVRTRTKEHKEKEKKKKNNLKGDKEKLERK